MARESISAEHCIVTNSKTTLNPLQKLSKALVCRAQTQVSISSAKYPAPRNLSCFSSPPFRMYNMTRG